MSEREERRLVLSELPNFVRDKFFMIQEKTGLAQEEILREYEQIFFDEFVQKDPQFRSDYDRHLYSIRVLMGRLIFRPPVREYEVIPIGIRGKRITKSGVAMSVVYGLVKTPQGVELKRIVMRNSNADDYKDIVLFARYNVKLGMLSGGDLMADLRTRWESPQIISVDPYKILEKLGVKRITIAEAPQHPSRIGSTGYVDELDWRMIRGLIIRMNRGVRPDGSEWGVYTIIDETVSAEEVITEDGKYIMPGFSVWVDPMLMEYDVESECDFVGTIRQQKDGSYVMDGFLILPVHAKQIQG